MSEHVLDNPVWASLNGHHAHLAGRNGSAVWYDPEIAPFAATANSVDRASLSADLPPNAIALIVLPEAIEVPPGLAVVGSGTGYQMTADSFHAAPGEVPIRPLGPAEVPAMIELTRLTEPGPFFVRTREMGDYFGIFDGGRLVAMAGERMHPPGYTEISAVCTHPDFQGRGYARALMSLLGDAIVARGETPFLHVRGDNAGAIALYEKLGFTVRTPVVFSVFRQAGADPSKLPSFLRGHD